VQLKTERAQLRADLLAQVMRQLRRTIWSLTLRAQRHASRQQLLKLTAVEVAQRG